jgi:hypothetical protein
LAAQSDEKGSLSGDEPWPDDLEPAGDFQITNMAEFHDSREQYRQVTGRIALIKYSPLSADGDGMRVRFAFRR